MIYVGIHTLLLFSSTFLLGSCIPQLVIFLSKQGFLGSYHGLRYSQLQSKSLKDWTENEWQYVMTRILKDALLVGLFVLQHSLMATDYWKRLLQQFNIYVCERLLYVISTCLVLNMLMGWWVSVPDVMLWRVDTSERSLLWLFFCLLHVAAWFVLFLQLVVMDPLELIGIKQVYYYHTGRGHPLSHLPKPLRLFYRHLRHAGPCSLCLMLWVHPVMTLDRFLLALLLSLYPTLAHRVTLTDYKFAKAYFVVQETTTTTTRHRTDRN